MSKLSRAWVEEFHSDMQDGYKPTVQSALNIAAALLLAWDALEGLDCFDDGNRIEPYCVGCLLPISRGHIPDCKLAKALPRED